MMPNISELTPNILRKLYIEDRMTDTQIARAYGSHQVRVNRLRKKWGIQTLSAVDRIDLHLQPLTYLQEQLVIGSLLGDGNMRAPSSRSARMLVQHCAAQAGYLDWKVKILGDYISSTHETRKEMGGKVFMGKRLVTKSSTYLRPYYELFYPPPARKRVFPANLAEIVGPMALAVWFMDDGSVMKGYHPRITFGLCGTSQERAETTLRGFGLEPRVYQDKGALSIHFPRQAERFYAIIESHMPPCMAYKRGRPSEGQKAHARAHKLTPELVWQHHKLGMTNQQIAAEYGVGASTVSRRLTKAKEMGLGPPPQKTITQVQFEVVKKPTTPTTEVVATPPETPRSPSEEVRNQADCEECEKVFTRRRSDMRFCSSKCGEVNRAKRKPRKVPSGVRVFTCKSCEGQWETRAKGRFTLCPSCKIEKKRKAREKICAYRECGALFEDASPKKSQRYCCEEHRRREKMFRAGKVEGLSDFRKPDPIFEPGRVDVRQCRCLDCKKAFDIPAGAKRNNRCPACREERRHKKCGECEKTYYDPSVRNTRKYCHDCSPPPETLSTPS